LSKSFVAPRNGTSEEIIITDSFGLLCGKVNKIDLIKK